jgi:hypothetical protein
MKEVAILKNAREGRMKGRGSDDFREDEFGGFNAANHRPSFGFRELRVES